jgi:hypothetical protein
VEGERESGWRRRRDREDLSMLAPVILHREARPPGTRREVVVPTSLLLEEGGGPRLNDLRALLKCDSKDN